MGKMKFTFDSRVEKLEELGYHVLPIPLEISAKFADAKIKRVICEFSGKDYRRAIMGALDGEQYLIFGKPALKEAGLQLGDSTDITMREDPQPDLIEMPEEFQIALDQDDQARERWDSFTPGKQRSLCHYINSAKRQETKIKRSVELTEKIRTHTLYGDKK